MTLEDSRRFVAQADTRRRIQGDRMQAQFDADERRYTAAQGDLAAGLEHCLAVLKADEDGLQSDSRVQRQRAFDHLWDQAKSEAGRRYGAAARRVALTRMGRPDEA